MFKIILCDDNCSFLEMEKRMIEKIFSEHAIKGEITCLHSGKELLALEDTISDYQLILLDVEMNEYNGIDVLEKIRTYSDIPVAFVTFYIRYSMAGYRVNAIRYILKEPKSIEIALEECIQEVCKRWNEKKVITMEVSCREGDISVSNDNLVMIASELHYIYFYVKQEGEYQKFSIRGKLDEFEKEFSCLGLLRVHKSFLINPAYVDYIKHGYVQMKTGERISVTQKRYAMIKQKYLKYKGDIL